MTIHRSLRGKSAFIKQRNVLTRAERVKKLEEEGLWDDKKSIFGLPKVKTIAVKLKVKKAPKEENKAVGG